MDELFEKLAKGDMPNFIEMMAAISELSNFWPESDCLDCRANNEYCQPQTKGDQKC